MIFAQSHIVRLRLHLVVLFPYVGEELVQLAFRRGRQFGEDAGEVSVRVDAVAFGGGNEGPECGVACCRLVVAGEEPGSRNGDAGSY